MLLDYRKDIDGLRAIAVMLVVLFHAGFAIPGGFIGVDIFFVISGFLITSLIQKQILRGKFSFKGFYLHRIRRILPALLAVIIAVFVFNWFALLEEDFDFFAHSLFFTTLSISNLFFWKNSQAYFSQESETIQLLHTWSLSVEEQFYFIVPIFLLILFKYFYKTKWFNYILSFVLISTFLLSQYMAVEYKSLAYFGLPARFFELFIGVWLALNYQKLPVVNNRIFNELLSVLALLLILLPAFLISKESIFPGYNALFVCLGTAIIIYLGKCKEETLITKALGLKPFVFIGVISYSLYLWHWPVFSNLTIIGTATTLKSRAIVIVFLIVISYLSWRLIEQPFRNKYKFNLKISLFIFVIIPLLLSFMLKKLSHDTDGFSEIRIGDNSYTKTLKTVASARKDFCSDIKLSEEFDKTRCSIGNLDKKNHDVLFYGDSHGQSIGGFMESLFKDAGLKAHPVFLGGAIYVENGNYDYLKNVPRNVTMDDVSHYLNYIEEQISSNKYKYVVSVGYYRSFIFRVGWDNMLTNYLSTVKSIIDSGAQLIIIKDVPRIGSKSKCPVYDSLLGLNRNCNISKNRILKEQADDELLFSEVKRLYPSVIFIDPKDVMCNEKECLSSENGITFYRDSNHITDAASKYLGQKYLEKVGNPFAKLVEKK